MAEHELQTTSSKSDTTDETLRLYLLCRLDDAERLSLDRRLLIDEELADRMLLAESELTDDYLAQALDRVERECFEKKFLTTESRRQMLRVSSALHDYSAPQSSPVEGLSKVKQHLPSWREGIIGLFDFGRPRAWAVSFAVLVVVAGLVWFVAKQRTENVPLIARNEPVPNASPQVSPQPIASPPSTAPSPPARKAESPTPSEPSAPPAIASFVLLPGAVRGGGNMLRVAVPDGERDVVRLNLALDTSAEGVYEAELTTVEGQRVAVRRKLKAISTSGEVKLTIDIPARLLQSGDYQIKLTHQQADGQTEPAGRYYFRALQ